MNSNRSNQQPKQQQQQQSRSTQSQQINRNYSQQPSNPRPSPPQQQQSNIGKKRDRTKEEIAELKNQYNNNNNNQSQSQVNKDYRVVVKTRVVTKHKDTHSDSDEELQNYNSKRDLIDYSNCDLEDLYEPADAQTGCVFDLDSAPIKFKKKFDALLNEVEEKKTRDSLINQKPTQTKRRVKKNSCSVDNIDYVRDKECPLLYHKHSNPPMYGIDELVIERRLISSSTSSSPSNEDELTEAMASINDNEVFAPLTEKVYGFDSMENYLSVMSMKPIFKKAERLDKILRTIKKETFLECNWIEYHRYTGPSSILKPRQSVIVATFRLERFDVLYVKLIFLLDNEKRDLPLLTKGKVFEDYGKARNFVNYSFQKKSTSKENIDPDNNNSNNNNNITSYIIPKKSKEELAREKEVEHKLEILNSIYLCYATRYYIRCDCDDITPADFIESINAD